MLGKVRTLLLAVPILLVAADIVFWRVCVHRLEAGVQAWIAEGNARGWTVQSSSTVSGGWPLAATLTITDLMITGGEPTVPGGMSWDAKSVVLRVDLLQPCTLEIIPIGVQRLRLANGSELPFVAMDMRATVPLNAHGSTPVDVRSENLRLVVPNDSNSEHAIVIQHAEAHADLPGEQAPGTGIGFSITAENITLPFPTKWPLGSSVASLSLEGSLDGPIPPPADPGSFLAAWRDAGGSLEVQKFSILWGPLNLTAAATLALDDQLQPMGAGTSRITGYDATLDALAGNGVLTRSAATAAKAVLSLMANAPTGGESAEVDVPLTLQYRTLSMRQVPLIRFPELDWPSR